MSQFRPIALVAGLALLCLPAGAQIRIGNVATTNQVTSVYVLASIGTGSAAPARLISWETLMAGLATNNQSFSNVVAVAFFGSAAGLTNFARFTNLLFGTATGTNVIAEYFYGNGAGLSNVTQIALYTGGDPPENVVTGPPGALYTGTNAGLEALWVKMGGTNDSGWFPMASESWVIDYVPGVLASGFTNTADTSVRTNFGSFVGSGTGLTNLPTHTIRIVGSIGGTEQTGLFRVPTNVTQITVEVYGAGGAGNGSAGGSAGGYAKKTMSVTTGQEYSFTLAAHPGTTTFATNIVATAGADAGGAAGAGSGGDLNIAGTVGDAGFGGYNPAVGVRLGPASRNDLSAGQIPCAGGGPGGGGGLWGAPSVILITY